MNNLFNEDDVFSWTNRKEAEVYIGKEGYLANSLEALNKIIIHERTYTLKDVSANVSCFIENEHGFSFGLFLPIDKVKQHPKWRPFKNYTEFNSVVGLGIKDVITYRFDGYGKDVTLMGVINDLHLSAEGDEIIIAGIRFTLEELFIHYTWKDTENNWRKFGVEE